LQDIKPLLGIENEVFDKSSFALSKNNFYYHIKKSRLFVAKQDEVILGYVLLLLRKNSKKVRIYSIAVSKKNQGKGVATFLLENAFLNAKKNDKQYITLEVNEKNEKAINLYKKFGFMHKKILKSYYADGSNAYLMVKTL
jgi:ribosomal-protein-alanine N-acetyltransferase